MFVHKIIYRLDFKRTCFKIIDKTGEVMELISSEAKEDSALQFKSDVVKHKVIAFSTVKEGDHSISKSLSIEPTCLTVNIETTKGLKFKSITEDEVFLSLTKITNSLCTKYQISDFNRIGIRFFAFSNIEENDNSTAVKLYNKKYDPSILKVINEELGEVEDNMIAFDGKAKDDDIHYKYRSGPCLKDEPQKYFNSLEDVNKILKYNIVHDIDLFETDWRHSVSFQKWFMPCISKASKAIDKIQNAIVT